MARLKPWRWAAAGLLLAVAVVASLVHLGQQGGDGLEAAATPLQITPELVARGAYLAQAGHCAGCHTARGGAAYAGGQAIATPFGTIFTSNLTPDAATGIGAWSAQDFWRALHWGRSRDGHLLYPAFPYPNFTQVTRADADALYAYLRSLPAVPQANLPHALRFPYRTQAALAVWRALYFKPAEFLPQAGQSAEWNRGAYLVRGLGHCEACHAARNALGATRGSAELGGGLIPQQGWYAPSLASAQEAGVATWPVADVVQLLKTGRTSRGSVLGPMAEVVRGSTQHLSDTDLQAMAVFLRGLPPASVAPPKARTVDAAVMARGQDLYGEHCADCHGDQGQGAAGAYPPLAGNRQVTMASPINLVRVLLGGGFAPCTAGNPRPYGMPPFGHRLNDAELAAVITYVRNAWGNHAAAVSTLNVLQAR
jgi:mono/diheme cytochrome c family protein